MRKVILGFLFSINFLVAEGQTMEVVYSNPKDTLFNYYIAFKPQGEVKGLLVLLTSFGESPQITSNETDIHKIANKNGLITVFASLQYGTYTFFIDSLSQSSIDQLLKNLHERYGIINKPIFLGGFSLGGSGVIKYAERANANAGLLKPKAIFAIDPPLDFERLYYSLEYAVRNSTVPIAKNEADYFIKRIQYEFQSYPEYDKTPFQTISPYSFSDTNQTNIKFLANTPVMLISEPDIIWQMEERDRSLYELNVLDCSLAINSLRLMGNNNAKLVLTANKGYRKLSGKKNPHSWSIADSEETINWLLSFAKN